MFSSNAKPPKSVAVNAISPIRLLRKNVVTTALEHDNCCFHSSIA
jgi:hypothetical protein